MCMYESMIFDREQAEHAQELYNLSDTWEALQMEKEELDERLNELNEYIGSKRGDIENKWDEFNKTHGTIFVIHIGIHIFIYNPCTLFLAVRFTFIQSHTVTALNNRCFIFGSVHIYCIDLLICRDLGYQFVQINTTIQ